jgi:hypothetical protein
MLCSFADKYRRFRRTSSNFKIFLRAPIPPVSLPISVLLFPRLTRYSALKTEAVGSCETSVSINQIRRCHILEGSHRLEKLKSQLSTAQFKRTCNVKLYLPIQMRCFFFCTFGCEQAHYISDIMYSSVWLDLLLCEVG